MAICGSGHGVAQGERAMGRQFGDEPLGQRLDAILLFLLHRRAGCPPMVMTARWTAGAVGSQVTSSAPHVRRRLPARSAPRPRGGHSRGRATSVPSASMVTKAPAIAISA